MDNSTLLGGTVNGRPFYLPVQREARINRKISLAGVQIEKDSEFYPWIMDKGIFSLNLFSGKFVEGLNLLKPLPEKHNCADGGGVNFYGKLKSVPMITDAPLALECRVYDVVELGMASFLMAEVKGVWSAGFPLDADCSAGCVDMLPISVPLAHGHVVEARAYS